MGEAKVNRAIKKKAALACISCRRRKVKCNITDIFPCHACSLLGIDCVKSTVDKRKERTESEYTHKLELRLKMYEEENLRISNQLGNIANVMKELSSLNQSFSRKQDPYHSVTSNEETKEMTQAAAKDKLFDESNTYFKVIPTAGYSGESFSDLSKEEIDLADKYPAPISFKAFDNKSLSVYGPTSVFDSTTVPKVPDNREVEDIYLLSRNPEIMHYIKLFFTWQYPDLHIFIFREAFLLDLFHARVNSSYCSKELVFAICSFGCLLSDDSLKKNTSFEFYQKAKELCFSNYYKPSISLLQSFLLLGLYDIYNGRNESGWLLSGIAMRMGYSIGLHLNPKAWMSDNAKGALGTKIRSRIFWGTYLVDHLIGLLLGRPSSLKMNDSTIEETIELPDIDWIHEYSFQGSSRNGNKILRIGDPLRASVSLMNIADGMLNAIFNDKQCEGNTKKLQFYEKLKQVKRYNLKIFKWRRELPSDLQWDRADLESLGSDPTKLTFKLLYYVVLLCLNRPFLNKGTENFAKYQSSFLLICSDALNDLSISIRKFVMTYGFAKCSTLITYCCVISISVILRSVEYSAIHSILNNRITKYQLLLFLVTLEKCSFVWGLSEKAYKLTKERLVQEYNMNVDLELKNFDFLQNVDFIPESKVRNLSYFMNEELDVDHPLDIVEESDSLFTNMDYLISREDSLGGPPIFMTANTFTTAEGVFSDNNINIFDYEIYKSS